MNYQIWLWLPKVMETSNRGNMTKTQPEDAKGTQDMTVRSHPQQPFWTISELRVSPLKWQTFSIALPLNNTMCNLHISESQVVDIVASRHALQLTHCKMSTSLFSQPYCAQCNGDSARGFANQVNGWTLLRNETICMSHKCEIYIPQLSSAYLTCILFTCTFR